MNNETKAERDQTVRLDVTATVYPVKNPKTEKGSTLAFAKAEIGGCFTITGIKIVEGEKGPFMAMPSQLGKDHKFHDTCFPTTAAMRESLNSAVMEAYRGVLEQAYARAEQAVERISTVTERTERPSLRDTLQNAMKDVSARPPQAAQRTAEQGAR